MAIIVEDGTGKTDAETYVSVAVADAYHTAMGNSTWTGTDAAKEVALRRAAQYIDNRYRFRGERRTTTQALEWPRVNYELSWRVEGWPVKALADATCEAALRALSAKLQTDTKADQLTEQTVGPITQKWSSKTGQMRYPVVDSLLQSYSASGPSSMRIERAS